MFIIQFFITYLKPIFAYAITFLSVYLLRKNKTLSEKLIVTDKSNIEIKRALNVQNKIIEVTKNTKRNNIAGNVERMRKNKL